MISKEEDEILTLLIKKKPISTRSYMRELHALNDDGLIILTNAEWINTKECIYHGCSITNKGIRAHEEYQSFVKNNRRSFFAILISLLSVLIALGSLLTAIFK